MIKILKHEDINTPHGNTIVWRYMGLSKFLDVLINSRLYFTNAEQLTDDYEFEMPKSTLKLKKRELILSGVPEDELKYKLEEYKLLNSPIRSQTLVNCWALGRHESYALWKIYLSGVEVGIAIRSNISIIKKAIINGNDPISDNIYIGKVQYGDHIPISKLSHLGLVTFKRQYYKYENELRLIIMPGLPTKTKETDINKLLQELIKYNEEYSEPEYDIKYGRYVLIDVSELIDRFFLSPFMTKWETDTIKQTINNIYPKISEKMVSSAIKDR